MIAHLYWVLRPSMLLEVNKKALIEEFRYIGSSVSAVNAIIEKDEMLRQLLPGVIGLSPNSPDWDKRVKDYWASTMIPIPSSGKDFNLTHTFSLTDENCVNNIKELEKLRDAPFKTSSELEAFVTNQSGKKPNVPIDKWWKYGRPVNSYEYLVYVYTQKLVTVANHYNDVDKSDKIKFYWTTDVDLQKSQVEFSKHISLSIQNLSKIIDNDDIITSILYVSVPNEIRSLTSPHARIQRIKQLSDADPVGFNKIVSDRSLDIKATIEKMVVKGILKRLEGSTIIIDSTDATKVLGNTLEEVIVFFNNPNNTNQINEYKLKLKKSNE